MKKIGIFILILFITVSINSQNPLKEQALEQFKAEHYHEAIATLEEALKSAPNDAEIYYYLGFFMHYIGSDSRLYAGYDKAYSDKILEYLSKAIELKPDYGDAKYFYGAECATRSFVGMQDRDLPSMKYYLTKAYDKGAFPKWLTEFGRNILNSCEPNSILFTAGDGDFNVCHYLQVVENIRTDISLMPIGNIDRPWYIQYIKDGFDGATPKVNISLSNNQIMQIRPFKWKTTPIKINISDNDKALYKLPSDFEMVWDVAPDYTSTRMHSKIEGEKEQQRTYLSPQRGMLLEIVESNMSQRPIYFTNFSIPTFYGGLENYFQDCGFVSKLMPMQTNNTPYSTNYSALEKLFIQDNFTDFKTIKPNIIPRIYNVAYFSSLYKLEALAKHYREEGNLQGIKNLEELFKSKIKIGLNIETENKIGEVFIEK